MPDFPELYDDDDADADCYDEVICAGCGAEYDGEDCTCCPECGERNRDRSNQNYTTDVLAAARYNWSVAEQSLGSRVRMGFELEMTAPTARPSDVLRDPLNTAFDKLREEFPFASKYCITKSDGSIMGPNPAEMFTIPLTVEEHSRVLYRAFPDGRLAGRQLRMWSNSSCGMHIHIGIVKRNVPAFSFGKPVLNATSLAIGKLMVFMHDPRNESFWIDICGRGSTSYCHFRRARVTDYSRLTRGAGVRTINDRPHHIQPLQRYDVLNVTNGRTLEFRLPRPTARIPSILKNLELFESSLAWVKYQSASGHFRYEDYLQWLAAPNRRKTYTYLHQWLFKKKTNFGIVYRSYI